MQDSLGKRLFQNELNSDRLSKDELHQTKVSLSFSLSNNEEPRHQVGNIQALEPHRLFDSAVR